VESKTKAAIYIPLAVALIGCLGTVVAAVINNSGKEQSTAAAATSSAPAATSSAPAVPATTAPRNSPDTAAGQPNAYFQGLIKVDKNGLDLDRNPPARGGSGNVSLRLENTWEVLQADQGVLLAESVQRSRAACSDALEKYAKSWVYSAQVGTVCVRTAGGRIGFLQHTRFDPDTPYTEFDALIWN
jgi:hypothetical protein